jgi:ParB family chromosome partitioning protein
MATHILNIPIQKIIESPYQGRFFNADQLTNIHLKKRLEELKSSIAQTGLVQPITVRRIGEQYELIDGHRRVEAYRQLGKGNIPALIKETDEKDAQVMSVVANLQRSNLSNIERAMAFEKILSAGVFASKKELSKAIGKDDTYVGDLMNMLKMDTRILSHVAELNPNADVRALRIIRKAGELDENGQSDAQHTLYLNYVHQKLTRAQLQDAVKKQQQKAETQAVPKFRVQSSSKGFKISLSQKLSKADQDRLQQLLEEKLREMI